MDPRLKISFFTRAVFQALALVKDLAYSPISHFFFTVCLSFFPLYHKYYNSNRLRFYIVLETFACKFGVRT